MKWEALLETVADKSVFSTAQLLSENESTRQVRLQLSHWAKVGRLIQLRRGLYALAPSVREASWHPFLIANRLQPGSNVSAQSALAFYGMIPEHVPVVTSVGPGRPEMLRNPLGSFWFRHITGSLLLGYSQIEISPQQLFQLHPRRKHFWISFT